VFDAVEQNNANTAGGYIERSGDEHLISGEGLISDGNALGDVIGHARRRYTDPDS
jgi:cobalt-zinc-cadmium resistance protein CzcA